MTWFAVLFLGFACPGDIGPFKAIPAEVRPLAHKIGVCSQTPEQAQFSRREEAVKELKRNGPGSALLECRNLRCRPVKTEWRMILFVDGRQEGV